MDNLIITEIYTKEQSDTFAQINVSPGNERMPMDHYYVGIAVKRQGVYLAKAVLYLNKGILYEEKNVGLVGAYEAQENEEAVQKLFRAIEKQAKEKDVNFLIGPMNGSTWENYRFHDHPEKPLFFMEMKHEPYYAKQWQSIGFEPIAHYYSAIAAVAPRQNEKIDKLKSRLLRDGVIIRGLDKDNYVADLKKLYPFLHDSFKQNFLYSPISESSFLEKYLPLQSVLKTEFVQIAEHDGEIVGVLLGTDDFLNPAGKTLIIKTLARSPKRLYRGLGLVLVDEFYQKAVTKEYQQIIYALMIDEGDATPLSDQYDGHLLKTYTLYGKSI
ncbi:GNAT family N-acetyltransferase [Sphingobacterium corticibacterium]|uniref:GNAT family N-acetyltransferase n=1 Tax=Sphingobacterium corticibacterium TaxID=2484746 RepID=A0A4Q6XX06_9SPHI|nr:GNAT family N-acetyltransferase [Sphingobacterium corticibacterium]RZF61317.1 GNAT family N-acetyltransferase [Sphingobacterium corticibacterium]